MKNKCRIRPKDRDKDKLRNKLKCILKINTNNAIILSGINNKNKTLDKKEIDQDRNKNKIVNKKENKQKQTSTFL